MDKQHLNAELQEALDTIRELRNLAGVSIPGAGASRYADVIDDPLRPPPSDPHAAGATATATATDPALLHLLRPQYADAGQPARPSSFSPHFVDPHDPSNHNHPHADPHRLPSFSGVPAAARRHHHHRHSPSPSPPPSSQSGCSHLEEAMADFLAPISSTSLTSAAVPAPSPLHDRSRLRGGGTTPRGGGVGHHVPAAAPRDPYADMRRAIPAFASGGGGLLDNYSEAMPSSAALRAAAMPSADHPSLVSQRRAAAAAAAAAEVEDIDVYQPRPQHHRHTAHAPHAAHPVPFAQHQLAVAAAQATSPPPPPPLQHHHHHQPPGLALPAPTHTADATTPRMATYLRQLDMRAERPRVGAPAASGAGDVVGMHAARVKRGIELDTYLEHLKTVDPFANLQGLRNDRRTSKRQLQQEMHEALSKHQERGDAIVHVCRLSTRDEQVCDSCSKMSSLSVHSYRHHTQVPESGSTFTRPRGLLPSGRMDLAPVPRYSSLENGRRRL